MPGHLRTNCRKSSDHRLRQVVVSEYARFVTGYFNKKSMYIFLYIGKHVCSSPSYPPDCPPSPGAVQGTMDSVSIRHHRQGCKPLHLQKLRSSQGVSLRYPESDSELEEKEPSNLFLKQCMFYRQYPISRLKITSQAFCLFPADMFLRGSSH